jgi:ADP-ribosylglycohydrolase
VPRPRCSRPGWRATAQTARRSAGRSQGASATSLDQSVERIRSWYAFDVSCQGTVPPAIVCALEATGYEDAIRNAVSLGGGAHTLACSAARSADDRV